MDRPLSVGIRHPLILKVNDLALLTDQDGDIPRDAAGLGLFFRDTCYLAGYRFRLHARAPLLLMASDELGVAARLSLTNPAVETANGGRIDTHKVDIDRTLRLGEDGLLFTDTIELANACDERICLPLSLEFSTVFESMFAVRGAKDLSRGELRAPAWDGRHLLFAYDGADDVRRTLTVDFSHAPSVGPRTSEQAIAYFQFDLAHGARERLSVSMRIGEERAGDRSHGASDDAGKPGRKSPSAEGGEDWPEGFARLDCSDREVSRLVRRSLADLALLAVRRGEERFTAAGLPWFLALFGRDSLIPSIQVLAFNPDLCVQAVRALAGRQGSRDDPRTGEAPGKILHEWRVGEAANLAEVQQTPSYVGVDATPLFLIALARHAAWSGRLDLFNELRGHVDRALGWMRREAATTPGGYLAYDGKTPKGGPINQAWRDSDDGVLRADGAYPEPPLALVEVQGYAFEARRRIAGLLRHAGEPGEADRLDAEASDLAARFERDFWMP
ncbi:MAG: glycogen debranching N-terminal domain-containing protein, partial [Caulobacteraceae bacterium]